MFNIADIIVVAIIGLSAFVGYRKGFVQTGLGFLSFFIAIALTFMLYKPVMEIIREKTEFVPWLTQYLSNLDIKELKESNLESETTSDSEGDSYIRNLPNSIVDAIGLDEMKETAKNMIVQKIVDFAVKLLAIVIVYIGTRLALFIVIMVLDLFFKLPVLKQFNEILGLSLGVALGLIRIYGVFIVITLLGSLPATRGIVSVIHQSLIASFLYNNNLLLKLLF